MGCWFPKEYASVSWVYPLGTSSFGRVVLCLERIKERSFSKLDRERFGWYTFLLSRSNSSLLFCCSSSEKKFMMDIPRFCFVLTELFTNRVEWNWEYILFYWLFCFLLGGRNSRRYKNKKSKSKKQRKEEIFLWVKARSSVYVLSWTG